MTTNIINVVDDALPGLANKINEATTAAESHARSAVQYALTAGALLVQAKARVPHGEWQTWLAANCTVAPRTASAYMRLATRLPELPDAERQRVADSSLRGALEALAQAKPTAPADPWLSRSPAERAETCFLWPDVRIGEVLFLSACGWSEERTAEFLGIDVGEVEATLRPIPAPLHDADESATSLIPRMVDELVDAWHYAGWSSAQNKVEHGDRRAAPGTAAIVAHCLGDCKRRVARHSAIWSARGGMIQNDHELTLYLVAVSVARAAVLIDPPIENPLLEYDRWHRAIVDRAKVSQ